MNLEIDSINQKNTWKLIEKTNEVKPRTRLCKMQPEGYLKKGSEGVQKNQRYTENIDGENILILAVYVDDVFVTESSLNMINKFKTNMAKIFEMTDLGKLTYYFRIEVKKEENTIVIKQEAYAHHTLKEVELQHCNLAHVPMEPCTKITKAEDEPETVATQYRRLMGYLHYLLQTRPDMAYAVGVISRYIQSLRESHGT
ncbi:hypothetical protein Lser_V15G09164 [Lactuca serriola]